jgi:Histone methylation protein DOT1
MNVGTACSATLFLVVTVVALCTRNCCEAYYMIAMFPDRPGISLRRNIRQSSHVGSAVVTASEYETRTNESPSHPTTMLVEKEVQKVAAFRTAGAAAAQDHHLPHHDRLVATTSAGVDVANVDHLLNELYPPSQLAGRNALSRTDGYWRYMQQGLAPPASLTYGEFDLYGLAQVLEEAIGIVRSDPSKQFSDWHDCVFTDLGSGTGRLVLGAAALYSWKLCRGIELLPSLHQTAVAMAQERDATILQNTAAAAAAQHRHLDAAAVGALYNHQPAAAAVAVGTSSAFYLTGSAVELRCGSFADADDRADTVYFGDSDCIFSFSTCMNGQTMDLMGQAIRNQCRPGTVVITTDYRLPETTSAGSSSSDDDDDDDEPPWWLDDDSSPSRKRKRRIRLLKEIPTYCQLVGGECTAFLHQVVE